MESNMHNVECMFTEHGICVKDKQFLTKMVYTGKSLKVVKLHMCSRLIYSYVIKITPSAKQFLTDKQVYKLRQ